MESTHLIVETGRGIDRIILRFDHGAEGEAYELLRLVLPSLRDLDRHVRRAVDTVSTGEPHTT